jgi:cephalosporin-C deacetylase
MPFFDMPLELLEQYKPVRQETADFDAFWQRTLDETRQHDLNARFATADFGLKLIETYDVTFAGYDGQPVKGWLLLPKERSGPLPCVVEYIGYGGGRGFPTDWLLWSTAGYAHLIMDTRGQGSRWRQGDTADLPTHGSSPHVPGFMTLGVLDPETYYYRRVFMDGVRAVEAVLGHTAVDPERIAVTGGSQGGGITIAVAGLLTQTVKAAMPEVPFLCHYRQATEIAETMPYNEIAIFCAAHRDKIETVFNTLSYFDGVNFASRAVANALFSAGLMDTICPPSTVYAAYNHYAGPKEIRAYTYNNHEGGGNHHSLEKIRFLNALWS